MIKKLIHKFNYNLYRFKYLNSPGLKLTEPVDLVLELSSSCQNRCGYCYHADQDKLPFVKGFMDLDFALSLLEQGEQMGVHSFKPNYRGEATLNPKFNKIVTYCKSLSSGSTYIDRIINSNFNFKTEREDLFNGLSAFTKVKVSFDSFIPEVMETQRAKSNQPLVLKNIDYFYNHKDRIKSETQLVVQAVRTKLNKDEDFFEQAKKRWPEASVSVRDMVAGRVDSDLSTLENKKRDDSERQSCIQAHARLIITHDGKALPCCPSLSENYVLGDAKKYSLYTIFNNEKSKKLREALLNKKAFEFDPCKTCSSHESYKGYKAPKDS